MGVGVAGLNLECAAVARDGRPISVQGAKSMAKIVVRCRQIGLDLEGTLIAVDRI